MALIKLKVYYKFLYRYYDPADDRIITDYYTRHQWDFNTQTLLAAEGPTQTYTYDQGSPSDKEEDYIRPVEEEFHHHCLPGTTTRRGYFHDGNGGFTFIDTANSSECGYTAPPVAGTVLRRECQGVDRYRIEANGSGGEVAILEQKNATSCGYVVPSEPVRGCTDPEASNYNEEATEDDGLCAYVPRLDITLPALLAAAGLPISVTLRSAATGQVARAARLLFTVNNLNLPDEVEVVVNGEKFVSRQAGGEGTFDTATTLAAALASSEALSARYTVYQSAPDEIELVALVPGSLFSFEATSSDELAVALVATTGVDEFRSQGKSDWGCFVEVYHLPGAVFGADNRARVPRQLGRMEQLYQQSNTYTFDVASLLLAELGHEPGSTSDRLAGYFVRVGETYTAEGQSSRRRYTIADSPVCFALESALPVPPAATKLGLSLPAPRGIVPAGRPAYAEAAYVLAQDGQAVSCTVTTRTATGGSIVREQSQAAAGGVVRMPLNFALAMMPADALRSTVVVKVGGEQVLSYSLQHAPAKECLCFLSRRGAYETVWLRGLRESEPKRQVELYSRGRELAMRQVQLTKARKLSSGLLDMATLDWLCDELASAPRVLIFTPETATYQEVIVNGFSPVYNEPENSYSVALDIAPNSIFVTLPE
ncbi:hypothetical protein [Hymenobacter tenuis]